MSLEPLIKMLDDLDAKSPSEDRITFSIKEPNRAPRYVFVPRKALEGLRRGKA